MLMIMIVINIHNMNTSKNETKHVAHNTQFCSKSILQHNYKKYKENKVGHKTCVNSLRYSINECKLKK